MDYLMGFLLGFGIGAIVYCFIMLFAGCGALGKSAQLTIGHNYKYDREADQFVKELLDSLGDEWESKVILSHYNIRIQSPCGYYEIWTSNKYYGYCSHVVDCTTYAKVFNDVRISLKQAKRVMELEAKIRGEIK